MIYTAVGRPLGPRKGNIYCIVRKIIYLKKYEKRAKAKSRMGYHSMMAYPYRVEGKKWSKKYKKSINCSNPKGFSQKAHCAGRKKK